MARGFDAFAAAFDYPLFVVTVANRGERSGCLIGFGSQVSIHPPRFLACLSVANHTFRVAAAGAEHLGVHLVPEGARDVAELFGGETGDETDKFARCSWREGPGGTPLLDACPDRFVGRVLERLPLGDHHGFLLEPVAVHHEGAGFSTFREHRDIEPGHEP
jgi:flavin reductase (DIM6/NTAB) family NADH-FMN oxidoreductase RutF